MTNIAKPKIAGVKFNSISGMWDKGKFIEGKFHGYLFEARVWDVPQANGLQAGKTTSLKILRDRHQVISDWRISWAPEECLFCFNEEGLQANDPMGYELAGILDKIKEMSYDLDIPDLEEMPCNSLDTSSECTPSSSQE